MGQHDPREPLPLTPPVARYSSRNLPPHRYLPGINERPADDPSLHRLGDEELFRHGVDLYNNAFFWEAHEAWETIWQKCKPGPRREGLQGLIQLAAALLKEHLAVPSGARKLGRTACEHLERAETTLPIDVGGLIVRIRAHFAPLDDPLAGAAPRPPIVVL